MEVLWKLEDGLKLTTKGAIVFLVGTAAAVTLLCAAATALGRNSRGKQIADAEWAETAAAASCGWSRAKRRLMGSFCWSSATRWTEDQETQSQSQSQTQSQQLVGKERSRNAVDPVWQRPILMGEKCQLPRFSGLILYDERGRLLRHPQRGKQGSLVRTTLRDLL